jgi:tetratricopeptide (TPR) repeat protein
MARARGGVLVRLALASGLALSAPALADQTDPRLEPLFIELRGVADAAAAAPIEAQIWQIWIEAGDAETDALMKSGMSAMARGDHEAALASFDALIDRSPRFAEAWNKRATIHFVLGQFERSVADIQQTLLLEPRHFGALAGLGLIYDALEQPAAALRSFEAALQINPHLQGARDRAAALRQAVRGRPT